MIEFKNKEDAALWKFVFGILLRDRGYPMNAAIDGADKTLAAWQERHAPTMEKVGWQQ